MIIFVHIKVAPTLLKLITSCFNETLRECENATSRHFITYMQISSKVLRLTALVTSSFESITLHICGTLKPDGSMNKIAFWQPELQMRYACCSECAYLSSWSANWIRNIVDRSCSAFVGCTLEVALLCYQVEINKSLKTVSTYVLFWCDVIFVHGIWLHTFVANAFIAAYKISSSSTFWLYAVTVISKFSE